jgi:hypothetical protein
MIADWNTDDAEKIQAEYVHKIGNLTLTWFNQNLSNFDFIKKRDRTDLQWKSIWYRNNFSVPYRCK